MPKVTHLVGALTLSDDDLNAALDVAWRSTLRRYSSIRANLLPPKIRVDSPILRRRI